MPEGDTIHRIAGQLAPRLIGKVLERVTTQGLPRDIYGRTVKAVTAHGKHLVIELDDGTHVRTHLGMYGRWRAYDRLAGEAALARLSPGRASLAITTDDGVYLWVGARTVEISHRRSPLHGTALAALGPDILDDDLDTGVASARAAEHGARTVADVLLDQRVVAGIGNIYKCEALFVRGIEPRALVRDVIREQGQAALARLYVAAHELMMANLGPGPRTTREPLARVATPWSDGRPLAGDLPRDDRYFVYGRTGKPCRQCGATIECYRSGDPPRWTWSCPHCQPRRS